MLVFPAGSIVEDFSDGVGGDHALAFGILADLVRHVHIDSVGQQPSCMSGAVANQPPVFHGHGRLGLGGRRRNRGALHGGGGALAWFLRG